MNERRRCGTVEPLYPTEFAIFGVQDVVFVSSANFSERSAARRGHGLQINRCPSRALTVSGAEWTADPGGVRRSTYREDEAEDKTRQGRKQRWNAALLVVADVP